MLKKLGGETAQIVTAISGAFGLCFFGWVVQMGAANQPKTMSASWKAAEKDYMRFQNLNPISGISSHK